ncbi:MAG: 4-(cytidine 5'-diphospho)-2-C-methyl-D-erythritol kinase [Beggiatoa sp. IS2]|nr:MAG: 4-(cytidine 5'-diphospho)-2-C-methyl-D-erythritol kinase [Beggiatoa sp. IS2]
MVLTAPAKLNLFLHITGRRPDGYHNLQTIFQFINYCDVLRFKVRTDGQIVCRSTAENLLPEQDLVDRAARLLKQFSGTSAGVDISVEKNIPIGGGLGGGSSDAATTLLAINHLWKLQLSSEQLAQLGLKLGADVPVFVHGHSAWAEGVGEYLTPITLEEPWYLVIYPNCQVSTAEIFSDPELTRNQLPITMDTFLAGQSGNVCEAVVRKRYPAVRDALNWLNQYQPARLTGTGACLFARFATETQAREVLKFMPSVWKGFIAQGKNVSPALTEFSNKF